MADVFLKGGTVIDERGLISQNRGILLKKGRIHSIGIDEKEIKSDTEVFDCSSLFITPGIPNLHTHSPMNIFKGIAEDVDEQSWFNEEIWPYESKMEPGDVYAGSSLAIAEMINRGVTAFADHYFHADQVCRAAIDGGIRLDMAPTLFGMAGRFDEQLEASTELMDSLSETSDLLAFHYGPHAPYTCSPDELAGTAEAAEKTGRGIHIHVADAKAQIEASREKYGRTPFQILKDSGVLDQPLIVGHGLWILEEEIPLIGKDTYFAVCPKTYMKLSAGTGRLWQFADRLPLAIGTDGAASSNSLDPLEQLKFFLLLGKLTMGDSTKFTLEEGWTILMKGHKAMPFRSGRIKEGYSADLIFWDLDRINTAPVYNPLASIIYSSGPENIVHSMVGGRFVKKNGEVQMDLKAIRREAGDRAKAILQRGKGRTKLIF
ncbi:amidohydrolase family protein [Spirochaeta isovalerica]|uniref:5-methylthioadenosine/S-adenosylhomocysteine deaminase n=1 Tax=Spirochaeta isovalerica TaxID=150 RepID=A0A841R660_9SPIO|nr:amidohydrolase family protein [Spirochaeta isovalerica]MBB6478871.1 5-methylthioadenosine/S-adenosylhomocysteine deaminase [Spirochaeta isovalerica]